MPGRLLWLDAIRVLAAQLIVLHHLSIYGPVGQTLHTVLPGLIGWLDDYGRIAVQVFLVIGGLLCANSVMRVAPAGPRTLLAALGRRYLRLFVPFYAALALVLIAAIAGRAWIGADWVPQWPGLLAIFAHLLGLYDYLGIEALSAGAWYVTIDFQLHALVLGLVWVSSRLASTPGAQERVLRALIVMLAGVSLLWVNRNPDWDIGPVYFFGSFALGFAAGWLGPRAEPAGRGVAASAGWPIAAPTIVGFAVVALALDWRLRIAVALACALVLIAGLHGPGRQTDVKLHASRWVRTRAARMLVRLGDISYALFLVHFSVCIVANALFVRWTDQGPVSAAVAFVAAWLLSLPVAALLHRMVELPLARKVRGDSRQESRRSGRG